jgi:HK97 gp10 family phage protein
MNLTSFSRYQPRDDGRFVQAVIDEAVMQAVTDWATAVFNSSQELVPVDTGELKDSGHVVVTKTGKTVSAAVVYDSDHSVFVEFGTGIRGAASAGAGDGPYNPNWPGMPAQPYLRPAFDQHRDEAESMTRETIAVALR